MYDKRIKNLKNNVFVAHKQSDIYFNTKKAKSKVFYFIFIILI